MTDKAKAFFDACAEGRHLEVQEALREASDAQTHTLLDQDVPFKPAGYDWELKLKPLHVAAWRGHGEVVELLVDKGANLDAQDKLGWTALQRVRTPTGPPARPPRTMAMGRSSSCWWKRGPTSRPRSNGKRPPCTGPRGRAMGRSSSCWWIRGPTSRPRTLMDGPPCTWPRRGAMGRSSSCWWKRWGLSTTPRALVDGLFCARCWERWPRWKARWLGWKARWASSRPRGASWRQWWRSCWRRRAWPPRP
ncbi:unnamed protein product, partial [Heterosigma akashiwo]